MPPSIAATVLAALGLAAVIAAACAFARALRVPAGATSPRGDPATLALLVPALVLALLAAAQHVARDPARPGDGAASPHGPAPLERASAATRAR